MKIPVSSTLVGAWTIWKRWAVYVCFFLSGATSLIFEVLWCRQFVTVFGNSSYAISAVLCAYMAGLGLGGLVGGKLADAIPRRVVAFGAVQVAVAIFALALPLFLDRLRMLAPMLPALSPESLILSTLTRFALSFAVLDLPCFLMGMTLPLLVKAVTASDRAIGPRIGALYCWNTLGAGVGCLAAGFWMLDLFGLRLTNLCAAGVNILIACAAVSLSKSTPLVPLGTETNPEPQRVNDSGGSEANPGAGVADPEGNLAVPGALLLTVAFLNGFASLACEVLWFRYLAFLNQKAYVFPTVLCIFLLGLGFGAFLYGTFAARIRSLVRTLGVVEILLAIAVLGTFAAGASIFAGGPPRPLRWSSMAALTVFPPTVLMGITFPLLCSVYGRRVQVLGRRVGVLFAINTVGTIFGSLLPVFVMVPLLGIQWSLFAVSLVYAATGAGLLMYTGARHPVTGPMIAVGAAALVLFATLLPSDLCQRVLLATGFDLGKQTRILLFSEGRTGTAAVVVDTASNRKTVFVNGASEVPVSYGHVICFKLLGDLGPMLHPNPSDVLMICLGGGIAAGATACLPDVHSITIVDLEGSVQKAAKLLFRENNDVLRNPKARVVIDDGRNYLLTAHRRWPVIISDSTHPKYSDSWVLYTREFYRLVRNRLTSDGLFVEWVPRHLLSTHEFKIIVRTFQSVFPHSSLWLTQGVDDEGQFVTYCLLVGMAQPLNIDIAGLRERLEAPPVRADLEPYGLQSPAGFLDSFICAEDTLRKWAGDGPVNTDDLPLTQYATSYSEGPPMSNDELVEPMEELWPYLSGTGSGDAAAGLRQELALRAKASRLVFMDHLADALTVLPNDVRFRQMRRLYEESPQYVESLLKFYWDNPEGLLYLANMRIAQPDPSQDVRSIFERVLALDPDNISALNVLGGIYSDMGDQATAEQYLRRAVKKAPNFIPARCNLALALERAGQHERAREEWKTAATGSSNARAALQWGICLAHENHDAEAIEWFRRAVELQPTLLRARLHLADLLHQAGRTQEALAHVRYGLKLDPENKSFQRLQADLESPAKPQPRL